MTVTVTGVSLRLRSSIFDGLLTGALAHLAGLEDRSLAHDVKGVAQVDPDLFSLGHVPDAVLARKGSGVGAGLLVHAYPASGQRLAEPVLLGVVEHEVHPYLFLVPGAVVGELLVRLDRGGRKQGELLRLPVRERGGTVERVEVVLEERRLLEAGRRGCRLHHGRLPSHAVIGSIGLR